jgi:hypothetical protein
LSLNTLRENQKTYAIPLDNETGGTQASDNLELAKGFSSHFLTPAGVHQERFT